MPFQQPKVICSKRSGMNWGAHNLIELGRVMCPEGHKLNVCTVIEKNKNQPDYFLQLVLVHVLLKPSY